MRWRAIRLGAAGLCFAAGAVWAGTSAPPPLDPGNSRVYVVGTAHLDTQWRWTIRETIDDYLAATLHDNFALFDKYPDYVFSFEGAFRYMLMKEYYPKEYERLRREIASGRWRVAGSWVDAVDTNMPSPESLFRHALYGNGYFRHEFGVTSRDVFLPDCFGFGYALPSIAAHSGIVGFSSQKLTWGSAFGVPFDIGMWTGVDGSQVVAALNPGDYGGEIKSDLTADSSLAGTIARQGRKSGLYAAFKYFGTGDVGGAPTDSSVWWLEKSMHGGGPVHVRSVGSDQLARDVMTGLTPEQRQRLPQYRGELLMTRHGAGCYTSQAAMKRFNRKNERLADAAERAAVTAAWLGGAPYPRATLTRAWTRFLWHQFHDDLTGTSIPQAYLYSWNDENISENEFAAVLSEGVGAVARGLDTRTEGTPVVVYNPLAVLRTDPVEAEVHFDSLPRAVRVFGPGGEEVPAQLQLPAAGNGGSAPGTAHVVFLATVPPVGFAVYDVRPASQAGPASSDIVVSDASLENSRYRVRIDADGDIASIADKTAGRELLAAPLHLQLLEDSPRRWAAWEIDYDDLKAAPRGVLCAPAQITVLESGPARGALEIVRRSGASTFRQVVRLSSGSDRLEVETDIDWVSAATLAKAAFPLAVAADSATYDLGLGTIRRGTDTEKLYEVPAQQWADLTARDGSYGVAILNDCKYGWDKPDDHTLRLTLVRTPEVNEAWKWIADQRSMDFGHHRMTYALCAHAGSWQQGGVPSQADRLNQPLLAFRSIPHPGVLGRTFTLLRTNDPAVAVRAVKWAEDSDEIVVRLQETSGVAVPDVRVEFAQPLTSARELNAAEEAMGPATLASGALRTTLRPYQPRTFAVRLGSPPVRLQPPASKPVPLPYNLPVTARAGVATAARFDATGSIPEAIFPAQIDCQGIPFRLGPKEAGSANAVACEGQMIRLPGGRFDRLYLVAAAVDGDRSATLTVDGVAHELWIQDALEPIGQWDNRLTAAGLAEDRSGITPGYVKLDPVAWVSTHRIAPDGRRLAYSFAHFFCYRLDIPAGARQLVLPTERRIRILALTAAQNDNAATAAAQDLYDRPRTAAVQIRTAGTDFLDSARVTLASPNRGAVIRYTLDGTDPTAVSAVYAGPVAVRRSSTLKARAFAPGLDDTHVAALGLRKLALEDASPAPGVRPGLACAYYEGSWRKVPDFASLVPVKHEIVTEVAAPPFARAENYGLALQGYLQIPRDGVYTLRLRADDGCVLWMGGLLRIDNDGSHEAQDVEARLALAAGLHPLRLAYVQGRGDRALGLWIEGPGMPLQQVPAEMLWHGTAGD
jgi:alpha-mannosidase